VRIGLALPQYDYSVAGHSPLPWDVVADTALIAAEAGVDSLWLSDHLFLDLAKYGGTAEPQGAFEPLVTLAALARVVPNVRLGTLVLCEALRPASVAAKALVTIDRISGGRLDVGVGAGWYEPDYQAVGLDLPRPGVRLARLAEAVDVLGSMLAADPEAFPITAGGDYHRVVEATSRPTALQQPRPPVFVGGKGDRLLRLVAERADGWNTCWVWTYEAYRERLEVLERACEAVDRDPATVWRSLGLYALCGEDDRDLRARFEAMRAQQPGVLDGVELDEWRVGRLVGTPEQIAEQAAEWAALGVETIILGVGCVPFHLSSNDDVVALAEALGPIRSDAAAGAAGAG